jgi:deazaflavin-dependent oxidoreductase (nitroreductase family)
MAGTFPPLSLKITNKVMIWLQRRGRVIGTIRLLTVPGRKSGKPRTTPVSPLNVDGHDYIIGGFVQGDWVKNVRAAGAGVLAEGKRERRVKLIEVSEAERVPVMRAFPEKVPHGVAMMLKTGVVADGSPEAFEAAAPNVAVFRVDPA